MEQRLSALEKSLSELKTMVINLAKKLDVNFTSLKSEVAILNNKTDNLDGNNTQTIGKVTDKLVNLSNEIKKISK